MNEDVTNLQKFYEKQLEKKGARIEYQEIKYDIMEIETELDRVLPTGIFKDVLKYNDRDEKELVDKLAISSCKAFYILTVIKAPFTKKAKKKALMEALELACLDMQFYRYRNVEWKDFLEELSETILTYSILLKEDKDRIKRTAVSAVGACLKKIAKSIVNQVNIANDFNKLAAIRIALGIYICNLEYLEKEKKESIEEAINYYKVMVRKPLKVIVKFFLCVM